jgi:hypothetical protein
VGSREFGGVGVNVTELITSGVLQAVSSDRRRPSRFLSRAYTPTCAGFANHKHLLNGRNLKMFRNTATAEVGEIEQDCASWHNADLIPVSVLALDLPAPATGWLAYLTGRDIAVALDDIGRDSITRDDARQLITERREAEAKQREAAARIEQEAIERDQRFRASLWQGVPADHMPPGLAPAAVMLQADKDAQPRRQTPLQHALQNSGELVYHPLSPTPDGES